MLTAAPGRSAAPRVSLLVAMRNEQGHIEACLRSIFAQDYPTDCLEVLVLDGCSNDRSWEIAASSIANRPNARLMSNPKITQSAGWNLGIANSSGDIIGIVSAHSMLAPDYVSTAVETLHRTGADMVGGPMQALGKSRTAEAIALATSTPFGVGGARFHYTQREEWVDTVYMGLCHREVYARIGGFDETMIRNQDDELSYRLLKSGGRILCNPAIRSTYINRATLGSLWRQYYQYGFWKVRVLQKHPRQMRLRQFVPPAFVAGVLGSTVLAVIHPSFKRLMIGILAAYLVTNAAASIATASRRNWGVLPLLPVVYCILHLSYGLGFLNSLFRLQPQGSP